MKQIFCLLGCLWLATPGAFAQGVSVELLLDQQFFLPHESLVLKVRVTNYSGQLLRLGEQEDWLTFLVEGQNKQVVSRRAPVPVQKEFALESSEVATLRVDLAPYFEISQANRYTVRASVRIPQWQNSIQSAPAHFDIINGTKIWEQDFGVPQPESDGRQVPEVRKFTLIQAIHLKQYVLYLRLSDAANLRVFRVFPLGPIVSFNKLEPQVDRFSNLHVLTRTGARTFLYSVVSPDGLMIARETHEIADSQPSLKVQEDGRVKVSGGRRRISSTDLPPPVLPAASTEPQP